MSKRAQPNSAGDKEVPAVRLGHPWCHPKCPHDDNHCPVETEERYLWAVCMCQVLSEMDTFRQQLPKTLAVDNPGTWDSGIGRVCPASAWVQEKACMAAGSLRKGSALLARIQWLLAFPTPMPVSRWGILKIFSCFTFHLIWHLDSHWPSWGASGWWFTCPWLAWYCRRKTMAWHPGTAQGGRLGGG